MIRKAVHKIMHLLMRNLPSNTVRIWFLKRLGAIVNGENYIAQNLFIMDAGNTELLSIGPNVAIGPNVTIIINSDPYPSNLSKLYPQSVKKIVINKNVWIGASVTILGGVNIGKNSIIAAGAIVVKDVPSFSIVAGNPAKVVKEIDPNYLKMEVKRN